MKQPDANFTPDFIDEIFVSPSRKQKLLWVEESFVFNKNTGKQIAMSESNEYLGSSLTKKRILFLWLTILIIYIIFIFKLASLQIFQGANYWKKAEGNRQRIVPIASERGLVYDRNGVELIKNIPSFSLALVPQDLPRGGEEREKIVQKLVSITHKDENFIRGVLSEYGSYSYESIVIEEDIDYETALKLQIEAADLPGIHIKKGSKRLYLHPKIPVGTSSTTFQLSLSHILGFEGKLNKIELETLYPRGYLPSDTIGKAGIEKQYETPLRGIYGKQKIEVNALGKEQSVLSEEAPKPGTHLILSLDVRMQSELERIMEEEMKKAGKKRGAAVVLNPQNGEVLALVSLPTFDNNDFSGGISVSQYQDYLANQDKPLFNRVFGGNYPSGSTIKPVIAAAALEEGVINASTSFLSTGGLQVGSWFFPDWLPGGHGVTNLRKSLAQSVNTFFYSIGGGYDTFVGLGVDRIVEYLKKFHFSTPLGIDLPGETSGFVPTREWKEQQGQKWYIGDTYNLSIGQGDLLVTPLQIASMTSFFASNGKLYQPHIVQSILDSANKQPQRMELILLEQDIVNKENTELVRLGMRDCVLSGSCRRLNSLPFAVAGKTGTAQWNKEKENHAWFTSFAPFESPEIVVTILVEEGGEGSRIAAPIAHEFYKWWGKQK